MSASSNPEGIPAGYAPGPEAGGKGAQPPRRNSPHSLVVVGAMEYYSQRRTGRPRVCWKFVSRADGYRKGSPTGCPEPVRWNGSTMIAPKRYWVYWRFGS
jgi:hypothetical protein